MSMIQTALAEFDEPKAMIETVKEYASFTIAVDGIGKVSEARKQVKRLRIDIEKRRKDLNEGALTYQRAINAEAKRLTAEIEPVEEILEVQEKAYLAEQAREKIEKEKAKAALLQTRVERLAQAGCPAGDLQSLGAMDDNDFEFHLMREAKKAEAARIEAVKANRTAMRVARMEALGVTVISAENVGELSDAQFEHDLRIAADWLKEQREKEEAAKAAELARQAEEIRIREEELKAERERMEAERRAELVRQAEEQRKADEERLERAKVVAEELRKQNAAMAEERRQLEQQREELRRQQAEIQFKKEAEEKVLRDKLIAERQAAEEAAEKARLEALRPEIEKAEAMAAWLAAESQACLNHLGSPAWSENAREIVKRCGDYIILMVQEGRYDGQTTNPLH